MIHKIKIYKSVMINTDEHIISNCTENFPDLKILRIEHNSESSVDYPAKLVFECSDTHDEDLIKDLAAFFRNPTETIFEFAKSQQLAVEEYWHGSDCEPQQQVVLRLFPNH